MQVVEPQAAINILQGSNGVNDGTPNSFVAGLQGAAIGQGMKPLETTYANVNGASACNSCGFNGDVATQFVGDGACARGGSGLLALCAFFITPSHTCIFFLPHAALPAAAGCAPSEAAVDCSLAGVKTAAGQSLPTWMLQAAATANQADPLATPPIDTEIVTATLRVGCAQTPAGADSCMPLDQVAEAVKESFGDGA